MAKKNLRGALASSTKAEADKFAAADAITGKQSSRTGTVKQDKVIRDAFSMPESDHSLLADLIQRAAVSGVVTNKSALVRAGLHTLINMTDSKLIAALQSLEKVKTGRPKT